MKKYTVTVVPKNPAYGDTGSVCDVVAQNKREARKKGRDTVVNKWGDYDRHSGALLVTAVESED